MWRPALLVMVGVIGVAAGLRADEPSAPRPEDATLRDKGLRKAGQIYVLKGEAEVAKLADQVRARQKDLVAAAMRQRAIDMEAEGGKKMIVSMAQQRRQLREQLSMATTTQEHNQIVNQMNELGDQMTLLGEGTDSARSARKEVARAVADKREAFMQGLLDLRNLVAETDEQYAALAADTEVKGAIEALNAKSPRAKVTLGPSRAYLAHVKALKKAEGTVQSEEIPLHAGNNTFTVDVTLNGKVSKPMVFDTGAGIILLPADLAARVGLKPTADDPEIRLQVADGRELIGRRMKLQSVRVGKFTVEDLECAVLPGDAQPLLGGNFLKHFSYKLIPEAGKLTLSKIATPGDEKPAPRPTRGGRKK